MAEKKKWIKKAIKHPGALHRALHVPQGEKIPQEKLDKATHSDDPTMRRRAQLTETLKEMPRHHAARAERLYGGKKRVRRAA